MRRLLISLRENAGLTRDQLANEMGVNKKTVQRWETGENAPMMSQRLDLVRVLDEHTLDRTVSLADIHRAIDDDDEGPINGHRVTRRLGLLVELEQAAGALATYQTTVVPGLLQTSDYATVVERMAPERPPAREVARRVGLRLRRQKVLKRLSFQALLDASVLRRTTGTEAIMAEQLARLRVLAKEPNIEVRVIPLDERAHAGSSGAFTLVTSPDDDVPFAVVTFRATGPQYNEESTTVRAYVDLWDHLWRVSHDLAKEHL